MAMELSEDHNHNGSDKETLYMLGGAALIFFGAGLILSNPHGPALSRTNRESAIW